MSATTLNFMPRALDFLRCKKSLICSVISHLSNVSLLCLNILCRYCGRNSSESFLLPTAFHHAESFRDSIWLLSIPLVSLPFLELSSHSLFNQCKPISLPCLDGYLNLSTSKHFENLRPQKGWPFQLSNPCQRGIWRGRGTAYGWFENSLWPLASSKSLKRGRMGCNSVSNNSWVSIADAGMAHTRLLSFCDVRWWRCVPFDLDFLSLVELQMLLYEGTSIGTRSRKPIHYDNYSWRILRPVNCRRIKNINYFRIFRHFSSSNFAFKTLWASYDIPLFLSWHISRAEFCGEFTWLDNLQERAKSDLVLPWRRILKKFLLQSLLSIYRSAFLSSLWVILPSDLAPANCGSRDLKISLPAYHACLSSDASHIFVRTYSRGARCKISYLPKRARKSILFRHLLVCPRIDIRELAIIT